MSRWYIGKRSERVLQDNTPVQGIMIKAIFVRFEEEEDNGFVAVVNQHADREEEQLEVEEARRAYAAAAFRVGDRILFSSTANNMYAGNISKVLIHADEDSDAWFQIKWESEKLSHCPNKARGSDLKRFNNFLHYSDGGKVYALKKWQKKGSR